MPVQPQTEANDDEKLFLVGDGRRPVSSH